MTYLILTSRSATDAGLWGMPPRGVAVTVNAAGLVHHRGGLNELPSVVQKLVIVNMAINLSTAETPKNRDLLIKRLKTMVGDKPRIWIHFGGINSPDCTIQTIADHCAKLPYADFKKAFPHKESGPMPYSQSSKTKWDKILQGLTQVIKGAVITVKQVITPYTLTELDSAWCEAVKKFDLAAIEETGKLQPKINAMKVLLAVAIYCDGLVYADVHATDKTADMRKLLVKEVPALITHGVVAALDSQGQVCVKALRKLTTKSAPKDIASHATFFLEWYRTAAQALAGAT